MSWSGTPGTSFGAFIWQGEKGYLNQHIFKCIFSPKVFNPNYLEIAINSRLDKMINDARGGVGLKHVTKGKIEAIKIPLPSLREQARIVKKLHELTRLLNEIELNTENIQELSVKCQDSILSELIK